MRGVNLVLGVGMLEGGLTYDFAKIAMDAEMLRMVKQVIRGINVNRETLAVDVIKQVGASSDYMCQSHTIERYKTEQSQSKIADRSMRNEWLANGGKSHAERAYEEARYILENHKSKPLSEGMQNKFCDILKEANEYYGIKNNMS